MKTKIRQGVFETNSSSTHSISISSDNSADLMDVLPVDENGAVVLEGGEFGWEQETYHDAMSKANYMMVYALDWSRERKEDFLKTLRDVIQEQTGCNEVVFKIDGNEGEFYPYGYIDHQSVENYDYDYVFEDKEKLRQFIFNKDSYLVTDNDNH